MVWETLYVMTPLMFGVYMMHEGTEVGRMLYIIPQHYMLSSTSLSPLLIIPISAVICFMLCIVIDCVRRFLIRYFSSYLICMANRADEVIGLRNHTIL